MLSENYSAPYSAMAAIGSGGNINKVFRLANCKTGKPLSENKMMKNIKPLGLK